MPAPIVAGEGVQLVHDDGLCCRSRKSALGSERLETSMTSIDSGVVNSRSGRSRMMARRREAPTSPCHRSTRRPTRAP